MPPNPPSAPWPTVWQPPNTPSQPDSSAAGQSTSQESEPILRRGELTCAMILDASRRLSQGQSSIPELAKEYAVSQRRLRGYVGPNGELTMVGHAITTGTLVTPEDRMAAGLPPIERKDKLTLADFELAAEMIGRYKLSRRLFCELYGFDLGSILQFFTANGSLTREGRAAQEEATWEEAAQGQASRLHTEAAASRQAHTVSAANTNPTHTASYIDSHHPPFSYSEQALERLAVRHDITVGLWNGHDFRTLGHPRARFMGNVDWTAKHWRIRPPAGGEYLLLPRPGAMEHIVNILLLDAEGPDALGNHYDIWGARIDTRLAIPKRNALDANSAIGRKAPNPRKRAAAAPMPVTMPKSGNTFHGMDIPPDPTPTEPAVRQPLNAIPQNLSQRRIYPRRSLLTRAMVVEASQRLSDKNQYSVTELARAYRVSEHILRSCVDTTGSLTPLGHDIVTGTLVTPEDRNAAGLPPIECKYQLAVKDYELAARMIGNATGGLSRTLFCDLYGYAIETIYRVFAANGRLTPYGRAAWEEAVRKEAAPMPGPTVQQQYPFVQQLDRPEAGINTSQQQEMIPRHLGAILRQGDTLGPRRHRITRAMILAARDRLSFEAGCNCRIVAAENGISQETLRAFVGPDGVLTPLGNEVITGVVVMPWDRKNANLPQPKPKCILTLGDLRLGIERIGKVFGKVSRTLFAQAYNYDLGTILRIFTAEGALTPYGQAEWKEAARKEAEPEIGGGEKLAFRPAIPSADTANDGDEGR